VVWRRTLGEGFSNISVSGGRLYTLFAASGLEYAAAFEATTGEELWRRELGPSFEDRWGNGPRSTPAVEGGYVYALTSLGRLASLRAADGTLRWRFDLRERFPGKGPIYGFSPSPIVDGAQLILEVGGRGGKCIAAFDKVTGELRWTVHDDFTQGYASPTIVEIAGQRQLVFVTRSNILGVSFTGELLWRRPLTGVRDLEVAIAMPVKVPPDRVFVSHRADGGSILLRPVWAGDHFEVEEIWESRFLVNQWSSTVFLDGYLYGFHNATLKCVSVEDGRHTWRKRGLGRGSLIAAGDKLLVLSDRGELVLLDATPEAYRERGRFKALGSGKTWTTPTLVGNRVYLRDHKEMVCLELPSTAQGSPED
jgi:outer membrane protein assembly factor BamB